jgi:HK97 family phage major capsid protein
VRLSARKLAALTPISNDLLRFSDVNVESWVRDDLVAALAERADLAFIRGDGFEDTPKGLRYLLQSGNVLSADSASVANATSNLGELELALRNNDVKLRRPGFIMAPRTERYLKDLRDGNNNLVFRDEMNQGLLNGYPYRVTTQIPVNLGSGSDESEIYFADFDEVLIGEVPGMRIDVQDGGSYYDSTAGSVQSAFSKDQTVVRAIQEHDINLRHDFSVAVLTGVQWGS